MFWMCGICSHINDDNNPCSYCAERRESMRGNNFSLNIVEDTADIIARSSISNTSTDRLLNCSYCTYLNNTSCLYCEMCNNPLNKLLNEHYRIASGIIKMQFIDESVIPDDLKKDISRADKIRSQIISQLTINTKFTDPEFMPNDVSIGIDKLNDQGLSNGRSFTYSVHWGRPEDLRGDEYSNSQLEWVVTRNPSSEDIVQGRLGNCWLLTGLALIADMSNLLDRILITKEINSYGIYQVRLCKDGIWTVITIDDLFPSNQLGQMIYSRANRKQLWVSIIEKAVAKLYGSYECLSLGYCADGLSILTGSPCQTLKISNLLWSTSSEPCVSEEAFGSVENISFGIENEDKDTTETIWAKLLSAKDANFVMCVSCGSQDDNSLLVNQLHQLGLRNLHAYAILDVKDIPSVNLRLLRLKNPWARLTWKGEWSDAHDCWNSLPPDIRYDLQPLGVTGESCGVFWISWNDVLTYFFALDICRYQSSWHELRMVTHLPWPVWNNWDDDNLYIDIDMGSPIAIPESSFEQTMFIRPSSPIPDIEQNNTCAVLTIIEPTQVQIVLWQSSCRATENKPVDILLVICKGYNEAVGEFVGSSNRQTSSYVTCDLFLDTGIYTIFYLSLYHWQANVNLETFSQLEISFIDFPKYKVSSSLFECALSVHSSKMVLLNRAILTPNMIPRVIGKLAISKGRKQIFGKIEVYTLMKGYSGMLMLIVNPADNSEIRCMSDCTGSINVRCSRGKNFPRSDDIISPGFSQITTVLTHDDPYSGFSLQHKYTASISQVDKLAEYPQLLNAPNQQHWPPLQLILHKPMKL